MGEYDDETYIRNRKAAVQMRQNGAKLRDIAEKFGVTKATAWRWTSDATGQPKMRTRIPNRVKSEVVRMVDEGVPTSAIVKKFNLKSYNTVYRIYQTYEEKSVYNIGADDTERGCWVLNHPYQYELEPAERERYKEVVRQRQRRNPLMGYDYLERHHISIT